MSAISTRRATRWVAVAWLVAAPAGSALGQRTGPYDEGITGAYGGVISWRVVRTYAEGDADEDNVIAHVQAGIVTCYGGFKRGDVSGPISGRGLLHITLGITPGADGLKGKGKAYSFEVACPDPDDNGANWTDAIQSYEQLGGEVRIDPRTGRPILPDTLRGSYSETTPNPDGAGASTITLQWLLCQRCLPPRPGEAGPPPARP